MANSRLCTIPDCGKPLVARGLCSGHYQRIQKKGYVRPAKPCSIEGCTRQFHSQGYCVKHYKRYLKYGDPLAGSTDWGAAKRFLEDALCYSDESACLTWPYSRNCHGRAQIRIEKKTRNVCRIICERAHGAAPTAKHQAAHSCGKGHAGCISPHHLSWKTAQENEADKVQHKTSWRTSPSLRGRLVRSDILEIRRCCATGECQRVIAKRFGIDPSTVSRIGSFETWSWV